MPNVRWLLALITVLHRALYRATGGRLGAGAGRWRFLLLETLGRRSGRRRTTPLLYVEDDDRFIVVASNAGDDRDPAWLLNLRRRDEAVIQVGPRRLCVRAREASDAEGERLWPKLLASYRHYGDYRTRTARRIPIVVLEPRADDAERV